MAVRLRARLACVLGVAGSFACAQAPQEARVAAPETQQAGVAPPRPGAPTAEAMAGAAAGSPARSELFLVRSGDMALELRAFGAHGIQPFVRVLAEHVTNVLSNPELELVWYKVDDRLWVIDTRGLPDGPAEPVLIASGVPVVGDLSVERDGERFSEPDDPGDAEDLRLHWDDEAWLDGGQARRRFPARDGQAWLARERRRPLRAVPRLQRFEANGLHVELPPGRAQCDDAQICGAALPFGPRGWRLLVANESEDGDYPEYGCLLHDPKARAFSTPPEGRPWGPAADTTSGSCGPFPFDSSGATYLASDLVCRVGEVCTSLGEGVAIAWLEPGVLLSSR
jgi:hypothetical protein